MFVEDFVLNGEVKGPVGDFMGSVRYDPLLLRPFIDEHGRKVCNYDTGRTYYDPKTGKNVPIIENARISTLSARGMDSPVFNATTLRKDEWLMLDRQVVKAGRERLRAWADLSAANSFSGFNGMSKMILEWETMADPGIAQVDMDSLSEGQADAPRFQLEGLPLPITHSSFFFSSRLMAVSRNTGTPLDATMAEACGRRVSESIEKQTIGVNAPGVIYGVAANYGQTPQVYGYHTHPQRNTKTDVTAPDGTNGATTVDEVLAMLNTLKGDKFYGPYMLYHSTTWDQYLDDDYRANDSRTLRDRLRQIDGIMDVRRLDFLTTSTLTLVQMTSEVARAVNGMDITLVQWETKGGMQLNFKVMAIQVPQIRADFDGNSGIIQGTES